MKPDGKYTPPSPINPVSILRAIILLIVLYLLTFYSPSLFHALAELFRIAIMLTIFVVFWNARRFLDNGYLFFISIAFLFISGLDLLHALASEGMTIFPGQDADLHSYLWIAARYVESISLLIAPFWVRRKPRTTYLFTGYTVLTVLLLNSIFVWNFYPASYLEKTMWGSFIGVNELLITFILLAAAFRLYQVRTTFALDVYQLMLTSILLAAAAELLFAFYPNNHSAPTHIAHLLRIASVYHVYRAVVETGIKKPHALLFRNLQQNETALRLSERRYKALFEQTNDAVFIISLDLVHQAVNEQAARMLGYSVQEIVGQKVERFIAPEELPDSQRRAEMLFSGEKLPVYERRFLHKDGSTRYGEISLALIKDEHGKPSHIQSIVHDVTERKRAEQVLQESENRSRSIIEQSYDGIVLVNERGEIIEWNRGEERITGLTRSEAIGQKAWDIQFRLTPFERRNRTFYEHGKKLLQDYFKTGTPPWLNQARDMKIRHTNGTIRYIQQLSFPIPTSKGYMLGGIVRNITEQKQAEEILRESEARYKALYSMVRLMCDNVPDLIWAKDMEKKYLFANRAICEKLLIARDTDEPIGKTDLYFAERERQAHPENPEWHTFGEICTDSDSVVMNSKQPERFDEFGNVQGEFLYLDVYKAPFWNEKGEMIGTVGCGRIVTREKWIEEQRKQAEKALRESNRRLEQTLAELRAAQEKMVEQERLAAVGQLAAGIAHEYNNLMASIILYADLIRRGNDLTPKQQEHLAVIQKQSLRAANLTQQLVDFARRSLLHKEALNLVDFLESLHLVLNDMLPKNIQLQLSLPTCEMSVHADPERLQQAMINLVANAREAMPDGGDLHIKLSYTRVTEGEDVPWPASPGDKWAQITVSDTGAGIPADVLPHVFEPFFTTRAPLGSGLGLSQVYGIVKQHEGHVSMKSEEGQGTCVTIYLPVKA